MTDNRDKFITANDVIVGIKTFKECYKENEKVFSPELVWFAYNVLNMVEEFVNRTPPTDVAKVVLCKDCKHYKKVQGAEKMEKYILAEYKEGKQYKRHVNGGEYQAGGEGKKRCQNN